MKSRFRSTLASAAAVLMLPFLLASTGCSPAQQQTTTQVVARVNAYLPSVQNAADTVAATIAALVPADAALIQVGDTAFDTLATTLRALCASYLANPSATVLAQIQNEIATLNAQVNTALLSTVHIVNPESQKLALAALKGLLAVVSVAAAMIAPTISTARLMELRDAHPAELARVRPYLDEPRMARDLGVSQRALDRQLDGAEAFGF